MAGNKKTITAIKKVAVTCSRAVYVQKAIHIYPRSEGASKVLQFEQISADQQLRERNPAYKFFSIH